MSLFDRKDKLVERSENEPRYNANNKTDRKIVRFVMIALLVLILLIALAVTGYYLIVMNL